MERLVVRVGGIASSRVRFRANRTLMWSAPLMVDSFRRRF